jgi:hypothetical protein
VAHAKDVQQMEYVASSLHYLTCELQRLLGIVVLKDQEILGSKERQEELDTLLDLLSEVSEITPKSLKEEVKKLVRHVQLARVGLVAFCPQLDAIQEQACHQLGEAAVHLIGWAWLRRAILGPKTDKLVADFPPRLATDGSRTLWGLGSSGSIQQCGGELAQYPSSIHRCPSLLSADLLAILAVWHNHRVAPRGLHQGQSPLMRAGLAKAPTDWLIALGYPHLASAGQVPSSIVFAQLEMESIAA